MSRPPRVRSGRLAVPVAGLVLTLPVHGARAPAVGQGSLAVGCRAIPVGCGAIALGCRAIALGCGAVDIARRALAWRIVQRTSRPVAVVPAVRVWALRAAGRLLARVGLPAGRVLTRVCFPTRRELARAGLPAGRGSADSLARRRSSGAGRLRRIRDAVWAAGRTLEAAARTPRVSAGPTVVVPSLPPVTAAPAAIGPLVSRIARVVNGLCRHVRPVAPPASGRSLAGRLGDGVTIGGGQRVGPDRAELAQPLFSRKIGAIVRLLAVVLPPAHRYLHTDTATITRAVNSHSARA